MDVHFRHWDLVSGHGASVSCLGMKEEIGNPATAKARREGHDSGLNRRKMSAFTLESNFIVLGRRKIQIRY